MATGGWVRDKYLGMTCKNMSIVFNSEKEGVTPETLAAMVQEYQTWEGGNELSETPAITNKITYNGISATFAKSKSSSFLYEDALTRDFTMNALYFNLEDLSVIDPLGYGIKDIENKVVSTCAQDSLEQDPFRMLRAITIAATYDLEISESIID